MHRSKLIVILFRMFIHQAKGAFSQFFGQAVTCNTTQTDQKLS